MIFTIFAITTGSGWYVANEVLPKIYTASGEMQINPRDIHDINEFGESTEKQLDPVFFTAEFEVIQSSDVLLPVINDLGLDKIWAKRYKSDQDSLPPTESLQNMNSILKLDLKRGTNIVVVSVQSEVPKEASDIANAIMDQYKTLRDVEEDQRNSRGTDSLREQIKQQEGAVASANAKVEELRKDLYEKNVDIVGTGDVERDEADLETHKHDLLGAKEDADARRVLLNQVQNLNDDDFVNTMAALGRLLPQIDNLRAQYFQVESEIDNLLKQGYDENHPRIQALRAEQQSRQNTLKDLIQGERRALAVDAQIAQSRVDMLSQEVTKLEAKVSLDQSSAVAPFRDAVRERDKQQGMLDAMTVRLKQVNITFSDTESPVKIITRAQPPGSPSKPD
ncbi:MAG TPA: hypothetical protein VL981_04270, partial [Candidatus Methylacidiphilales bacterium]|nr:hypothetical protein [Candidatus Methylacidiphilales bacterium]